jgi:putative acetyltransferase
MIAIRPSMPADGARAIEIWRAAVDATHDFLKREDRAEIDAFLCGFLPTAPLWLAVDADDRALGFMLLSDGHMDALFIDPAWHGTGIGRALVAHARSLHSKLTVDVNEQNLRAGGFYRRLGFMQVGRSETDDQGRPYPLLHLATR